MTYYFFYVNICVYICVGMTLTTGNNKSHGNHILEDNGRTLNSATHSLHSDQML